MVLKAVHKAKSWLTGNKRLGIRINCIHVSSAGAVHYTTQLTCRYQMVVVESKICNKSIKSILVNVDRIDHVDCFDEDDQEN